MIKRMGKPEDKDMDYQNIVYCLNGKCKDGTCIRQMKYAPFGVKLTAEACSLDKNGKCKERIGVDD